MKPILFPIMMIICSGFISADITLKEAVLRGIDISKSCTTTNIDLQIKKKDKISAQMKKRFALDSRASYIFKSVQPEITQDDINIAPGLVFPGYSRPVGTKHNFDFNMSLKQPLFYGNILTNNVRLKDIQLTVGENLILLSKLATGASIKTSYFNYWLLKHQAVSLESLIKQLKLHQQSQMNFFRQELIRKSDVLETETKINEQRYQLEDINQRIEKEKINFQTLCDFKIEEVEKGYIEVYEDFDQCLQDFSGYNPFLKTYRERIAGIRIRKKIKKGEYLPAVAGFAELHYGKPGIDFFQNQWDLYFQGGLQVSLKVFDWQGKKRDLQILDYEIEKIEKEREDFFLQGKKNFKQLFSAKESVEKKLKTVRELIRITAEDIVLKAGLLREQQISNIDYLTVLIKKERYVAMEATLKYNLSLLGVQINHLIGRYEEVK